MNKRIALSFAVVGLVGLVVPFVSSGSVAFASGPVPVSSASDQARCETRLVRSDGRFVSVCSVNRDALSTVFAMPASEWNGLTVNSSADSQIVPIGDYLPSPDGTTSEYYGQCDGRGNGWWPANTANVVVAQDSVVVVSNPCGLAGRPYPVGRMANPYGYAVLYRPSTQYANDKYLLALVWWAGEFPTLQAAMTAPMGSPAYPPAVIPSPCDLLSVSGPSGSTRLLDTTDRATIHVSWADDKRPALVGYRYGGVVDAPGFFPFALGSPIPADYDHPILPLGNFEDYEVRGNGAVVYALSSVWIACDFLDAVSHVRVWQTKQYGAAGWTASADIPRTRNCANVFIRWPQTGIAADGTVTVIIAQIIGSPVTGANPVDVSMRYNPVGGTATAWSAWQTAAAGSAVDGSNLYPSLTFGPIAGATTFLDWEVRCRDAVGTVGVGDNHDVNPVFGKPGDASWIDPLPPPDEANCFNQSDIGINPSSWVPGLGRIVSCLLRWLFQPTAADLNDLYRSAQAISDRAPVSFVVQTVGLVKGSVGGAAASITANRNGCLTLLPGGLVPGVSSTSNLCPSTLDSPAASNFRTILGVLFWIGFAWTLFSITRRMVTE